MHIKICLKPANQAEYNEIWIKNLHKEGRKIFRNNQKLKEKNYQRTEEEKVVHLETEGSLSQTNLLPKWKCRYGQALAAQKEYLHKC